MAYNTPNDCKYTKSDEWVRMEDGVAVIGVTDYAQQALSDVVYVDLPDNGKSFARDGVFGSVESVKAASDLHVPIGGTVTEVNEDLADSPEWVNQEPYGKGWFIKVKPSNPAELESLMDAAAYTEYCNSR
jgi:glycine cleavage system H protein